jgi:hypothetical protein
MLGFYHRRIAKTRFLDMDATFNHLRNAAEAYLSAAERFPEDDEHHVCK